MKSQKYKITIKVILSIALTLPLAVSAAEETAKCGKSELYAKYSDYKQEDKISIVKSIIQDMKSVDVDILAMSELDMEQKLRATLMDEVKPYALESKQNTIELQQYAAKYWQTKDENKKKEMLKTGKRLKKQQDDCRKEGWLLEYLQEARRVIWYKNQCEKHNRHCASVEPYSK